MQPQVDGFEIVGRLGEGGMAQVWLARDVSGDQWALKVLRLPDERLAERMRAEGALQGALDHPNVVPVVAMHEDRAGRPVLQMPYVAGPSLEQLLLAVSLDVHEIDAIARDLLAGAASAHERGWVHRDLKPANVLLARHERGLLARITDFGLAGVVDAATGTFTRQGAGTRRYMSQEQVAGERADPRMDVFALGAVLWELIEGRPAFADQELWRTTISTGVGPVLMRPVPARMREAVAAALSADRPADATALGRLWISDAGPVEAAFQVSTLHAALSAQPVPEPVMTAPTEVIKPSSASRWRWLGRGLGLAGLVALAWAGWWGSRPPAPDTVDVSPSVHPDPAVQRRFALAWEQFADARLPESEQTLRSLARSAPGVPDVYVLMALNQVARGRYQSALESLDQAKPQLASDDARTRRLIAALERSMFRVPDGDPWPSLIDDYPDDLMIQAVGCAQLGLRPDAQRACLRARAIDDLPVMSWVRGQWALWDDQHDVARAAIDDFLDRSPDHPLGLLQDGWWHAAFGDWEAVRAAADRALQIDPSLAEARLLLAHAHAHTGDPEGRTANLALALGETTSLHDRLQLGLWDAQGSVGLGQIEAADARLDEVQRAARAGGAWFWLAAAALERLEVALLLEDPSRMSDAVARLEDAAEQPGVAPPIVRRVSAAAIYGAGRAAAHRGDASAVLDARSRLLALDQEAVGWIRRDRAVAELDALAHALEREPERLLALARVAPGCTATVRGGETLLRHGFTLEGEARVWEGLTDLCPRFGYPRYMRAVARQRLGELAQRAGRLDEAEEHLGALQALWPGRSP